MNTTHEYTDDQLQSAIDRACVAVPACRISLANWTKDWREEKAQRLSIAKAFLAALPHPTSQPTRTSRTQVRCLGEKPNRVDANKEGNIFVVYATQDPDRKKGVPWPWDKPFEGDQIAWFSLPDEHNQPSPPMIRLRLPSEKPTMEDADKNGCIFIIYEGNYEGKKDAMAWPWHMPFDGDEFVWFSLPDDIIPREPTQEEKWRSEFEKCFPDFDLTKQYDGGYLHAHAATAWRAFLAAKKGGAK